MAFLKKQVLEEYAAKHKLNLDGMSWAQANLYVQEEAKKEGLVFQSGYLVKQNSVGEVPDEIMQEASTEEQTHIDEVSTQAVKDLMTHINELEVEISRLKSEQAEDAADAQADVGVKAGAVYQLPDEEIVIKPGLQFMRHQLIKVEETLGDDVEVEEVSMRDSIGHFNEGTTNRTFRMKGSTGRKVVAQSTLPKEQVKITFNYARDIVPVIHANDGSASGYLWSHHSLPNVKELLVASNSYNEYKELFSAATHPENVFYCGNLIGVRKDVVHEVFHEIEVKHAAR